MLTLVCCALAATAAAQPVLTVDGGGHFLKDGAPCRAIGINYFSAFSRTLEDAEDTSYREGFDVLLEHGIPFIRFMACGFWPKEWRLYLDDKAEYFRRMDAFVKTAEDKGLGLVPSLFWWDPCVPDIVGEPRSAWGDPSSKTIAFMRQYVAEVVGRYAESPAIWMWELGNEYNLAADLPNAAEHRPWAHPNLGTPETRSAADDITHDMLLTACREFGKAVRQHDTLRPITTGNSIPRPSAHHQRTELSWKRDTREQFTANLIQVTPDPLNVVSIHLYPHAKKDRFGEESASYEEILNLSLNAAREANKALFVGEFGAPDTDEHGGPETARKEIRALLEALQKSGVQLATLWVFDLPHQDSFINITPTNHRSYLLDELKKANEALREHKEPEKPAE